MHFWDVAIATTLEFDNSACGLRLLWYQQLPLTVTQILASSYWFLGVFQ